MKIILSFTNDCCNFSKGNRFSCSFTHAHRNHFGKNSITANRFFFATQILKILVNVFHTLFFLYKLFCKGDLSFMVHWLKAKSFTSLRGELEKSWNREQRKWEVQIEINFLLIRSTILTMMRTAPQKKHPDIYHSMEYQATVLSFILNWGKGMKQQKNLWYRRYQCKTKCSFFYRIAKRCMFS